MLSTDSTPTSADVMRPDALPPLYVHLLRQGFSRLEPWRLLDVYERRELIRRPAPALEGRRAHLFPFAACIASGTIACFLGDGSGEVLLCDYESHGETEPVVLTILPSLAEWLGVVLEDFVAGCPRTPRASATPSAGRAQPAPTSPAPSLPPRAKEARATTRRHLLHKLRELEVNLDFVTIEAGDQPASASVRRYHERVRRERGEELYVDMLFVLTQQRFPARVAKWLWTRILAHKAELASRLGREVDVTVASLDFLNSHEHLVQGSLVLCSEEELTQVAEVALRDGLTGLFDQATFRLRLNRELERARRYGGPYSVALLDLDHFKRLNDEHGHLTGDDVLRRVGRLLRAGVREVDLVSRYGGEEFAILFPETTLTAAQEVVERLREAVARAFAGELRVTLSAGVASGRGGSVDADRLIAAADAALYDSKAAGRNRTTLAPPIGRS